MTGDYLVSYASDDSRTPANVTWHPVRECSAGRCWVTVAQSGPSLALTVSRGHFVGRIGQIGVRPASGHSVDVETYDLTVLAEKHGRATRLKGRYTHDVISGVCPSKLATRVVLVAK